jgi:formylglycine-generating enzyme required for sulfatase activity
MKIILILLTMALTSFQTFADLSPEFEADRLLIQAKESMDSGNYHNAVIAFEKIMRLTRNVPTSFHFHYGKALASIGKHTKAKKQIELYLEKDGRKGQFYQSALSIYTKIERAYADQQATLIKNAVRTMTPIPAGSFKRGQDSKNGLYNSLYSAPAHRSAVSAFLISQTEVTFAQWDTCVNAGGCSHRPEDEGWGRGNRPVINVSHNDITKQFIPWVNTLTGDAYRLPTEAEWEYAARAGTTTAFSTGNCINTRQANFDDNNNDWYSSKYGDLYDCNQRDRQNNKNKTVPVKSYSANAFGLYDMHGNVKEWTQDCWHHTYDGAPSNGRAWTGGDCSKHGQRGGSWRWGAGSLHSAARFWSSASDRGANAGFRLAQDQN